MTYDPKARRSLDGRVWRALDDVNFGDSEDSEEREAEPTLPPINPLQQVLLERAARGRMIRERWKRGVLATAMHAKPKNPFGIGAGGGVAALVKAAAAAAVQDDPAADQSRSSSAGGFDGVDEAGAVREYGVRTPYLPPPAPPPPRLPRQGWAGEVPRAPGGRMAALAKAGDSSTRACTSRIQLQSPIRISA